MAKPAIYDKKLIALVVVAVIIALSFLLNRPNHIESLALVDSLLMKKEFQQALDHLQAMDRTEFKKNDHAYYNLLMTQAKYRNAITATNDSAIKMAVDYYRESGDRDKYARSLIYQGCVNEQSGHLEKAVECYKTAIRCSDMTDLDNRAFATLRMASLYQSHYVGSPAIAVSRYKEALALYRRLNDVHYQIICLGELGNLYCADKQKSDSALIYINNAIKLAQSEPQEHYSRYAYYYSRAQYHVFIDHDYRKGKQDALRAITSVDSSKIDHPRAHLCAATAYLHLGMKDSCDYYIRNAPPFSSAIDSIAYYTLLWDKAHVENDQKRENSYRMRAHLISDSILVNGLHHRMLAVEKRYDLQQAELQNEKLQSELKNICLVLAVIAAIALGILSTALGYRNRLKEKEYESELLRADLDSSVSRLELAQTSLSTFEEELHQANSTIAKLNIDITQSEQHLNEMEAEKKRIGAELDDSNRAVSVLNKEITEIRMELANKQQDRDRLIWQIAELEAKKGQSDEIKAIMGEQIKVLHELMQWAYELDGASFTRKFNSLMTIQSNRQSASYWSNLQSLVNDLYNGILVKAQERAGGSLRNDELNYIALYCCGFSRTAIMVCMNYKHLVTISNKKVQIAKKLGVNNLDDFVKPFHP